MRVVGILIGAAAAYIAVLSTGNAHDLVIVIPGWLYWLGKTAGFVGFCLMLMHYMPILTEYLQPYVDQLLDWIEK